MSSQTLEKRLTPEAVDFFQALLGATMGACVSADAVLTDMLQRFKGGTFLQDGTVISLPSALEERFKDCGGNTPESGKSALRVQVRLNLTNGQLLGPWIKAASECEREGEGSQDDVPLPDDAHYPIMSVLKTMTSQGKGCLTHLRSDWLLTDARGVKQTVIQFVTARQQQAGMRKW